jgi:hypothetical protein
VALYKHTPFSPFVGAKHYGLSLIDYKLACLRAPLMWPPLSKFVKWSKMNKLHDMWIMQNEIDKTLEGSF